MAMEHIKLSFKDKEDKKVFKVAYKIKKLTEEKTNQKQSQMIL